MAHPKNNIPRFKSISTGLPCSTAQYVAELVCLRKRERDNVGSLEYKFWNKSHKEEYQIQVRVAHKLIKKFGEDALVHYITSPSGKNVFSLGFLHKSQKFVLSLRFVEHGVAKAAIVIQSENKREKKVLEVPDEVKYQPKKSFGNKTLLSQIQSIEGSGNG